MRNSEGWPSGKSSCSIQWTGNKNIWYEKGFNIQKMTKTCTICEETKSLEDFAKNKACKLGRRNQCNKCQTQYNKRLKYSQEYYESNREVMRYNSHKLYTRKSGAKGSHTLQEWLDLKNQYGHTCPRCGVKEPNIKLSTDHIIPLSQGGLNYISNIQPLCKPCNSSKHVRTIKFSPIASQNITCQSNEIS